MVTEVRRCAATTRAGDRCRGLAMADASLCRSHAAKVPQTNQAPLAKNHEEPTPGHAPTPAAPPGSRPCAATEDHGGPCRGLATGPGPYCGWHALAPPAYANEQRAKENTLHPYTDNPPATLTDTLPDTAGADAMLRRVTDRLEQALEDVYAGKITPSAGSTMASIAGQLVRLAETTALRPFLDEVERRLRLEGEPE